MLSMKWDLSGIRSAVSKLDHTITQTLAISAVIFGLAAVLFPAHIFIAQSLSHRTFGLYAFGVFRDAIVTGIVCSACWVCLTPLIAVFARRLKKSLVLLRMQEIEWIEAERDYIRIAAHKTNYLVRETMQGIHAKLDATRFLRIHRSTIVNLLFVRELEPLASGECFVTLRDGRQFTMSRGHRAVLGPLLGIS